MDGAAGDGLTRRDLLKIAGAGGLATAFGAGAGRTSQARLGIPRQHPPDNARYDVVVVGGGVSGAYVAWRLLEDDPSRRVALCEMGERIGGRLLSVTPPGAPHLRAELGGMRLLNTQEQVVRLIEHLGLTIDRMRRPDAAVNVHICGEAWSTGQGWVQGALATAEQVLQQQLGLGRPVWLPAQADIGTT